MPSPAPGPQSCRRLPWPSGAGEVAPAAAGVRAEPKCFVFGEVLHFTCTRQQCVCVFRFCFVKVKFVFLSNMTSSVYLRACWFLFFFFELKGNKKKPTDQTHTHGARPVFPVA